MVEEKTHGRCLQIGTGPARGEAGQGGEGGEKAEDVFTEVGLGASYRDSPRVVGLRGRSDLNAGEEVDSDLVGGADPVHLVCGARVADNDGLDTVVEDVPRRNARRIVRVRSNVDCA